MATATDDRGQPYLRLVKTELNFFMKRILYMQEPGADSLAARRGHNTSTSSMNNSGSRVHVDQQQQHAAGGNDELLQLFDSGRDESEDVFVYSDNPRILPNSQAQSWPPLPFPQAGPESPRQVERHDGVRMMTPTHIPTDPLGRKPAAEMPPVVPLSEMTLDDIAVEGEVEQTPMATETEVEQTPMVTEREPEQTPMATEREVEQTPMATEREVEQTEEVVETVSIASEDESRAPVAPRGSQIFPRNQSRSVRNLRSSADYEDSVEAVPIENEPEDEGAAAARPSRPRIAPRPRPSQVFPRNQRRRSTRRISTSRERFSSSRSFASSDGEDYEAGSLNSNSAH